MTVRTIISSLLLVLMFTSRSFASNGQGFQPFYESNQFGVEQKSSEELRLLNLYSDFLFKKNDPAKADSIRKLSIKLYPHGIFARREFLTKVQSLSGDDLVKAVKVMRKKFPVTEAYKTQDADTHFFLYANVYKHLCEQLFREHKYFDIEQLLPDMNLSMLSDAYLHGPQQALKFETDPKEYEPLAKAFVDEMERKAGSSEPTVIFAKCVYVVIACRAEKYQEAVNCMNSIPKDHRFTTDSHANEAYIVSQQQLGHQNEALAAMKASVENSKMTTAVYDMLHRYYDRHETANFKTFDSYVASLKSEANIEILMKEVKSQMVDEPFEPFLLKGLVDAADINSANFRKGEIVILDFWATWCAPCIAALEGMQMAVNRYKNNKGVNFYFVVTQDHPTADEVRPFWQKKGYHDMPVMIDGGGTGRGRDNAEVYSTLFPKSSGIPQKAILKDGRIRYRASGYKGSPSGLMDEISAAIEILEKEK